MYQRINIDIFSLSLFNESLSIEALYKFWGCKMHQNWEKRKIGKAVFKRSNRLSFPNWRPYSFRLAREDGDSVKMPLNWRGNLWYYLEGNEFTVWMLHTHTGRKARETNVAMASSVVLCCYGDASSVYIRDSLSLVFSFDAYFLPFLLYPSFVLLSISRNLPEKCIFLIVFLIASIFLFYIVTVVHCFIDSESKRMLPVLTNKCDQYILACLRY